MYVFCDCTCRLRRPWRDPRKSLLQQANRKIALPLLWCGCRCDLWHWIERSSPGHCCCNFTPSEVAAFHASKKSATPHHVCKSSRASFSVRDCIHAALACNYVAVLLVPQQCGRTTSRRLGSPTTYGRPGRSAAGSSMMSERSWYLAACSSEKRVSARAQRGVGRSRGTASERPCSLEHPYDAIS